MGHKKETFEQFMGRVDNFLRDRLGGLTHEDVPDMLWRDCYNEEHDCTEAELRDVVAEMFLDHDEEDIYGLLTEVN